MFEKFRIQKHWNSIAIQIATAIYNCIPLDPWSLPREKYRNVFITFVSCPELFAHCSVVKLSI